MRNLAKRSLLHFYKVRMTKLLKKIFQVIFNPRSRKMRQRAAHLLIKAIRLKK